jgi:hypothetical protein
LLEQYAFVAYDKRPVPLSWKGTGSSPARYLRTSSFQFVPSDCSVEVRVVDLRAAVRRVLTLVGDGVRTLLVWRGVLERPDPDAELEERVRRAFRELEQSRLFEPSNDFLPTLLERLRRRGRQPCDGNDDPPVEKE